MEYAKWLLLPGLPYYVWFSYRAARSTNSKPYVILMLMSVLYPLGKVLQFWHFGPLLPRWYLSDIGFLASVGFARLLFPYGRMWHRSIMAMVLVVLACGGAILLEIAMLHIQEPPDGTFQARGDVVDIVLYLVTAVGVLYLLNKIRREVAPLKLVATYPKAPSQRRSAKKEARRRKRATRR